MGKQSDSTLLMVGTRKGLWVGRSDERRFDWDWQGPFFEVDEVYSCMVDTRGERARLFAGTNSMWLGPQVQRSDDLGATWEATPNGGPKFPEDVDASVERVWQLAPGTEPHVVYAGTEPGAIFRSEDRGETFELVRGLWDHPHRPDWNEGFGGQAFHTILPHPTDPASVTAALSTGGVYQTSDGGRSWEPRNHGIRAEFLPEGMQFPEFGQCVHKIVRHPSRPERLYLQNHGGVYRTDDHAKTWDYVGDGLPSDFGFAIVVHPHEPDTIYVFPIGAGDNRFPPEGRAQVWRSRDAGDTWEPLSEGLPQRFFNGVMRDAMCADAHESAGVYVGARNGSVYASADSGDSWREVIRDLPDVLVVRAAAL